MCPHCGRRASSLVVKYSDLMVRALAGVLRCWSRRLRLSRMRGRYKRGPERKDSTIVIVELTQANEVGHHVGVEGRLTRYLVRVEVHRHPVVAHIPNSLDRKHAVRAATDGRVQKATRIHG